MINVTGSDQHVYCVTQGQGKKIASNRLEQ